MDPSQGRGDVFGTAPLLNEPKGSPPTTASATPEQQAPSPNYRTAEGKYRSYLLRNLYGPLKFVLFFGIIGALLSIPVIVIDVDQIESKAVLGDIDAFFAQQTRQVLYYIFGWLLISWVGLAISFAVGTVLPYTFRFIARCVMSSSLTLNVAVTDYDAPQIREPGPCAVLAGRSHLEKAPLYCRSGHHLVHWFCGRPSTPF